MDYRLGLIRDFDNPILKAKVMTISLQEAFQARGHGIDTLGFTDIGETPAETS